MGDVATLVARPAGIPAEISDSTLMAAVREYLLGGDVPKVTQMLGLGSNTTAFYNVVRGAQWRTLQNHFASEFLATTGSRMIRLENLILDKLETYIECGIKTAWIDKNGEWQEGRREVSPKELVSVGLLLDTQNKRIDKLREGEVTRKTFDGAGLMRKLEAAARFAQEREVEGRATREQDDPE